MWIKVVQMSGIVTGRVKFRLDPVDEAEAANLSRRTFETGCTKMFRHTGTTGIVVCSSTGDSIHVPEPNRFCP